MLAIVIPYYKKSFFWETLQSLANQTDKRFRVYIGNDASPESPQDLLLEFKDKLDVTYHKFDENLGGKSLVQHWKRCLEMTANEDWISILGDDDLYAENVVELFYAHINTINKQNCKVVRYATQIIDVNKNSLSKKFTHPRVESGIDFINRKFTKQTRSSLSEHFFNGNEIRSRGFIELPLAWHSDDLAVFTYSCNNKTIYSINETSIFIRVSSESITGSHRALQEKSLATQEFILKYMVPYKNKIKRNTLEALHLKLEHSFFLSNSKRYLFNIIRYYIVSIEFYALTRFIYLSFKNKLYAGSK